MKEKKSGGISCDIAPCFLVMYVQQVESYTKIQIFFTFFLTKDGFVAHLGKIFLFITHKAIN